MSGKKEEVGCYTRSGTAKLQGFVSNGLDSSTLINLIVIFDSEFEEFKQRGFTFPPNLFFYHEISRTEVIGVLINVHKFTKDEAVEALEKLISQFNLQKIIRNAVVDEQFERIVEESNRQVIQKLNNPRLKIGDNDIIIIAGFLRSKINVIHSGDNGFLKTCEELGINTIPLPLRDFKKEQQLKEWLKKRKN